MNTVDQALKRVASVKSGAPQPNPAKLIALPKSGIHNGPPMCEDLWLAAFDTESDLKKWFGKLGDTHTVTHKWLCMRCGYWHHFGAVSGPTGASSGTDRRKIENSENNERKFKDLVKKGLVWQE